MSSLGVEWVNRLARCLALVGGVLIVLVAIEIFIPRDTTYLINVVTEELEVTVRDLKGVSASLPETHVIDRSQSTDSHRGGDVTYSNPILDVPNETKLSLARKREGDLYVQAKRVDEASSGSVTLTQGQLPIALRPNVSLRVKFDRQVTGTSEMKPLDTLLLSFQGQLSIGNDVRPMVKHILLEGKISVIERAWFIGQRYLVRESQLEPGDVVTLRSGNGTTAATPSGDDSMPTVKGFVQVGNGPGIRLVAYADAVQVQIRRFGAAPYEIGPSIWDRVAHDPILGGTLALLAGLGSLMTVLEIYLATSRSSRTK